MADIAIAPNRTAAAYDPLFETDAIDVMICASSSTPCGRAECPRPGAALRTAPRQGGTLALSGMASYLAATRIVGAKIAEQDLQVMLERWAR